MNAPTQTTAEKERFVAENVGKTVFVSLDALMQRQYHRTVTIVAANGLRAKWREADGTEAWHTINGYLFSTATYYSVGRNGTWTTEPAPASFFTSRGATISPSRIHPEDSGIMTLWIDGTNAGTLFPKQEDQIAHLKAHGLLDAAPLPKPAAPATRGARGR